MKYTLLLASLLYGSNCLAEPIWQAKNKAGGYITLYNTLCQAKAGYLIETKAAGKQYTGCYLKKDSFVYVIWDDKTTDLYLSSDFSPVNAL